MTSVEDALISIRPVYAESIFAGLKTVELRRRIPPVAPGLRLWIYVTKPVGAVLGVAEIEKVFDGSPDALWKSCGSKSGIERVEFDRYFAETDKAYGLALTNIRKGSPATMQFLKEMRPGFHPPQVISRLSPAEAAKLAKQIF